MKQETSTFYGFDITTFRTFPYAVVDAEASYVVCIGNNT